MGTYLQGRKKIRKSLVAQFQSSLRVDSIHSKLPIDKHNLRPHISEE
jgi:hypothetical protein